LTSFRFAVRGASSSWTDALYVRAADNGAGGGKLGFVGFGSNSPRGRVHISATDESVASALSIRQSNDETCGFDIGLDQSINGNMYMYRVNGEVKSSVMSFVRYTGNVGIGTDDPGSFKLAVEGKIGAREVNVNTTNPWPDYVFEKDYALPSL